MGGISGSANVVGGGFSLTGGFRVVVVVVVLGVAGVGLCLGGNLVFSRSSTNSPVWINLGLRVVNEGKGRWDCRTCARSSSLLGSLPLAGRTGGGKRLC